MIFHKHEDKCLNYHKELFEYHQHSNIDKNKNAIFIDIGKNGYEKNLNFFVKYIMNYVVQRWMHIKIK